MTISLLLRVSDLRCSTDISVIKSQYALPYTSLSLLCFLKLKSLSTKSFVVYIDLIQGYKNTQNS